MPSEDRLLRDHLLELLRGGSAHADSVTALKSFPVELRGKKPEGAPYSAWQLLEHLRIAQHDILEFCVNSHYLAPKWPDEYWPKAESPASEEEWDASVKGFHADLREVEKLVQEEPGNLYAKIPWGETILREILLVADHNAYHLGQLVLLRKLLDAWKG
jgi:DinB superfamily